MRGRRCYLPRVAALAIARLIITPPSLAMAALVILWRYRRPDRMPLWLTVSLLVFFLSLALASQASAFSSPHLALGCLGVFDVAFYAIAARMWIERRPKPLTGEEAASEARRHADEALDLTAVAEREAKRNAPR